MVFLGEQPDVLAVLQQDADCLGDPGGLDLALTEQGQRPQPVQGLRDARRLAVVAAPEPLDEQAGLLDQEG